MTYFEPGSMTGADLKRRKRAARTMLLIHLASVLVLGLAMAPAPSTSLGEFVLVLFGAAVLAQGIAIGRWHRLTRYREFNGARRRAETIQVCMAVVVAGCWLAEAGIAATAVSMADVGYPAGLGLTLGVIGFVIFAITSLAAAIVAACVKLGGRPRRAEQAGLDAFAAEYRAWSQYPGSRDPARMLARCRRMRTLLVRRMVLLYAVAGIGALLLLVLAVMGQLGGHVSQALLLAAGISGDLAYAGRCRRALAGLKQAENVVTRPGR